MVTSTLSCIPVGLRAVLGTALSLIGSPSWGHGHGTLGSGTFLVYGSPRVSAHPLRELGLSALGSSTGDLLVCRYHGRT